MIRNRTTQEVSLTITSKTRHFVNWYRAAGAAGARPEHLTLDGEKPFATTGVAERVERLGESSYAHVRRADDKLLVAEIRVRTPPTTGEKAPFGADLHDVHAFDARGRRLDLGA